MSRLTKMIDRLVDEKAAKNLDNPSAKNHSSEKETNPKKKRLFSSMQEFCEFNLLYFLLTQFFYIVILLIAQSNGSLNFVFSRVYSMAVLISCVIYILIWIGYGCYRSGELSWYFLLLPFPLLIIIPLGFANGFSFLGIFFAGMWMSNALVVVFFALGIIIAAANIAYFCYCESEPSKKKTKMAAKKPINEKNAEDVHQMLRTAISDNAIHVRFQNRKWRFGIRSDVMFGYDEQNKQFVFVDAKNSYTLSSKSVIFLAYENPLPDESAFHRLIKLYYLGADKEEQVLPLFQTDDDNENISRLQYYASTTVLENSDAIFIRKIRHIGSTLEHEFYPNRPFTNEEWFDVLQECMERAKNKDTDGYSLFKEKVVSTKDYLDDEAIYTIVCDLSIERPDKTSAKKEAKKLCRQDFSATLKSNLKSSVKDLFSNKK